MPPSPLSHHLPNVVDRRKHGATSHQFRSAVAFGTILLTLLVVACGSSDETPPTTPALVANSPPTVEATPPPIQSAFADGQFTVNFLYRSDSILTAAVEVIDVDALLETSLGRIGSLLPGEKFTINFIDTEPFQFRNPSTTGLIPEQLDRLTQRGFIVQRISADTIAVHLNPLGSIDMAVLWRDVIPSAIMESVFLLSREILSAGVNADSLLDFMVGNGLGIAIQEEAFPGLEGRLRRLTPDFAEVVFDLTPEIESDIWEAARPDLDTFSSSAIDRILRGQGEFAPGAGTAVGYRIVQAYLQNNPGVTASSLLLVATEEIFEGSNYNP